MKLIFKTLLVAAIPLTLILQPDTAVAQKKKEKKQEKVIVREDREENVDVENGSHKQMIIITRTAEPDEKTVVEVKDGKVSINGKKVEDGRNENVDVKVVDIPSGAHAWSFPPGSAQGLMAPNVDQNFQLFNDENDRALLGVVTETDPKGVEIKNITEGSAAEKAGLQKGDVITSIDDTKIESPDQLAEVIADHEPGDEVTVHYSRDGKDASAKAELGKWKGFSRSFSWNGDGQGLQNLAIAPRMRYERGYLDMNRPRLGISVQETEDGKGVEIIGVDEDGMGAKEGLKEGDIITKIEGHEVHTTDDVARPVRALILAGSPMNFEVIRDGKPETIVLKVPRKLKTADL